MEISSKKVKSKLAFISILALTLTLFLSTSFCLSVQAEKRTVVDMVGRKVELPAEVKRLVTTYTPATQFVMALGADDRLVSGSSGMNNQKLFKLINPELRNLKSVGSKNKGLNLETIMELKPDLVIVFPHNDGVKSADRLKELGIPALVINPESFKEIRKTNLLLGKALNLKKEAAKIDQQYQKISNIVKRTNQIPESKKKKVYFANSEFLDTVGENILQTDLIELAGGINPAKDAKKGFIRASAEEVIKWNPDLVMVSQFFRKDLEELKRSPKYQATAAFKNDEIYRIPSKLEPWDYPSPSSSLLTAWLAFKLYPAEYSDLDFKKIADDFYLSLYGRTYTELNGELN